ncbi:MAG: type II toxin-antitoxin system PemK/MazF family toxin [Acidimicrobiaceae bacterium]|nr:type II toxin-antitoxin system PemK/MazF family toxin [Acidimicrobiaceae bacterium]MXX43996.1 type II toxin-antitoxin system PemK/MazF family toxin [Acidimicrobiales bacterium]MYD32853.1 type II toxin-antitoxin system PemK/MazF family toxin [Acidimicrobiales bacterium]MYI09094.1 type II toxin-antitoxin system PemK/MazF family toxin [Acidimicrobiales bacterium]MYI27989.1 type II toxin-antitoxin system PemK/MazF family toxin [Acidimicrobiales bacterium]
MVNIGDVFLVADRLLNLPPEGDRKVYPDTQPRPFVVLSFLNGPNPDLPTVLGCPISSETTRWTPLCVKLGAGEAGLNRKSWIRIPALQPVAKTDLPPSKMLGRLPQDKLEVAQKRILVYLGLSDG